MERLKVGAKHCFWPADKTEFTTWFRTAFLKERRQILLASLVLKANVHRK